MANGGKGLKMKPKKKAVKIAPKRKKRAQSAPSQNTEPLGSIRSMMAKMDAKLGAIPKGGFANKGEQLGSRFGTLGALAGRGLGAGLSAITGYGNYTVKKNSLGKISSSVDMVPQFVKNEHSIRVCHREFIQDVAVPGTPLNFNMLYAQKINPGNSVMFPWLARMAKQYSQYKIHGMVFTFKTMTSDYSANGPLGTIMMATNYDAIERVYANKIELENSEFAVSCKPSESLVHAIECDPKYSTLDMLYIRDSSYATSEQSDRRFYDFGTFQLATSGLPGAVGSVMGEMWVSYDIELTKPIAGGEALNLTSGTAVISQPSGALSVGSSARPLNIEWSGNAYTPAAGEVVPIAPSSSSILAYSGDVSAIPSVYRLTSNNLVFSAAGKYIVTWSMSCPTSNTSYDWAVPNNASTSCKPTFQVYGTAAVTCTTPFENVYSDNEIGYVPVGGYNTSTGGRASYCGVATITVTGIPIGTSDVNFVQVTSPTYVHSSTNKVGSVVRKVNIEYVAFGTNQQSTTFTQS